MKRTITPENMQMNRKPVKKLSGYERRLIGQECINFLADTYIHYQNTKKFILQTNEFKYQNFYRLLKDQLYDLNITIQETIKILEKLNPAAFIIDREHIKKYAMLRFIQDDECRSVNDMIGYMSIGNIKIYQRLKGKLPIFELSGMNHLIYFFKHKIQYHNFMAEAFRNIK